MNPSHQQLADLLRQARQVLNDDYLKDQTTAYSRWKVECDTAWLSKGIMLPYPSSVEFPTEKAVIAKALELYNQLYPAPAAPLIQPAEVADPVVAPIVAIFEAPAVDTVSSIVQAGGDFVLIEEPVVEEEPIEEPIVEEEPIEEPVVEEEPIEEPVVEEEPIEEPSTSRLRNLLSKFMSTATELESKNTKGTNNV